MSETKDSRLERNRFASPETGEPGEAFYWDAPHAVNRLLDARHGLIQPGERLFLYGILCAMPQKFIRAVEIGTWKGTTMQVLRRACDELYCIDPEPQWIERAEYKTRSGNQVRLVKGSSPEDLEGNVPPPYTFAFVDGNHSEEGVYRDTMGLEPLMERGGVICFHDGNHPPVRQGIDRACKEWKRRHNLYHCACDTIAETPEGVFGGITVMTVEGQQGFDSEPFAYSNPPNRAETSGGGFLKRLFGG